MAKHILERNTFVDKNGNFYHKDFYTDGTESEIYAPFTAPPLGIGPHWRKVKTKAELRKSKPSAKYAIISKDGNVLRASDKVDDINKTIEFLDQHGKPHPEYLIENGKPVSIYERGYSKLIINDKSIKPPKVTNSKLTRMAKCR